MLSDAIKLLCIRFEDEPENDETGLVLTLRVFELEARNMEGRIHALTGRPHVALDGRLMSAPAYRVEGTEAHHA